MKRYIRCAVRNILDDPVDARADAAMSRRISMQDIIALSDDSDDIVRSIIARRKDLPIEVQEKLVHDSNSFVRQSLAYNRTISTDVLRELSNLGDWYVNSSLAGNPNTPVDVLDKLVNTLGSTVEQTQILKRIVLHPNLSEVSLRKLAANPDPELSASAQSILSQRYGL